MARVYVVTEEEMIALIDSLELEKMRKEGHYRGLEKPTLDDIHRAFHFVAVRWVQAMGFKGRRD